MTIQAKIIDLMSDGRERTCGDIQQRLGCTSHQARYALRLARDDGDITSALIAGNITAYRIAPRFVSVRGKAAE